MKRNVTVRIRITDLTQIVSRVLEAHRCPDPRLVAQEVVQAMIQQIQADLRVDAMRDLTAVEELLHQTEPMGE